MTSGDGRRRLFFAVALPGRVRQAVDRATAPLRSRAPDARWTSPESWHLTLAFLGWVAPEQLTGVEQAGTETAASAAPFTVALSGAAGTFRGGVLWAEVEPTAALAMLADDLRDRLQAASFDPDTRPFRPHLTLARTRRRERLPRGLPTLYKGPRASWRVQRLLLMRSHLGPGGAVYDVHAAWPLGAGTSAAKASARGA